MTSRDLSPSIQHRATAFTGQTGTSPCSWNGLGDGLLWAVLATLDQLTVHLVYRGPG